MAFFWRTRSSFRSNRRLNRIIRGLYFEITKTLLPVGDYTRSILFSQYVDQNKDDFAAIEFIQCIPHLSGRVIGEDTFEFRYSLLDQDRFSSFWYLEFYRRFAFVGTTGNQNDAEPLTDTLAT